MYVYTRTKYKNKCMYCEVRQLSIDRCTFHSDSLFLGCDSLHFDFWCWSYIHTISLLLDLLLHPNLLFLLLLLFIFLSRALLGLTLAPKEYEPQYSSNLTLLQFYTGSFYAFLRCRIISEELVSPINKFMCIVLNCI